MTANPKTKTFHIDRRADSILATTAGDENFEHYKNSEAEFNED
jgi:hypothetical protein